MQRRKNKTQENTLNATGKGAFRWNYPAKTHKEKTPDPEELPFKQLGAKIV